MFIFEPVAARREAERAAAAHAAELEPEEDQLRHELARLHDHDHDADDRGDERDCAAMLERP